MEVQIKYIPNKEIDRDKWDSCVKTSINGRIYATSFFLDIFCPGWDAVIIDGGKACMPVTRNRKYSISYLSQPVFLQQLGYFFTDRNYSGYLHKIIIKITELYRFIEIALNEANELYFPTRHWQVRNMKNLVLNLGNSYESLYNSYHANTRRNIIRARRSVTLSVQDPSPEEIVGLFIRNTKGRYPGIRSINYTRLQTMLERGVEKDLINIRSCYSVDGKLITAACFLKDFNRDVFFFSANSPEGIKQGSMFRIVDDFIKEKAGNLRMLDFNGSMEPGVQRFYRGFGSEIVTYQRLCINNLPFPLRLFKSRNGDG